MGPELAILHKEQIERLSPQERQERAAARDAIAEKKRAAKAARQAKKEAAIKKVDTGRWSSTSRTSMLMLPERLEEDTRELDGDGQPHDDRTRGKIKIPTSVE